MTKGHHARVLINVLVGDFAGYPHVLLPCVCHCLIDSTLRLVSVQLSGASVGGHALNFMQGIVNFACIFCEIVHNVEVWFFLSAF